MENNSGSWRLSRGLAEQSNRVQFNLVHRSDADNLKFIKNKSHKNSLKTLLKLETNLKQMR